MKSWITKSGCEIIRVLNGRSNVFLITNRMSNILVDTGPGFLWNNLRRSLTEKNIYKIDLLILTHSHFDHAANSRKIKEVYGARVIIHDSEAEYILAGNNILPSGTNPLVRSIVKLFAKQFVSFTRYEPCKPDILVGTRYDLFPFGVNAYILHTPGHTHGSLSVIVENEIALVGDTMFGILPKSIFPPFANDIDRLIGSWKLLLDSGCTLFLPSHGTENSRILVETDYKNRK